MQLHAATKWHVATLYFTISSFIYSSSTDEIKLHSDAWNVIAMLKVTKCINSFNEALTRDADPQRDDDASPMSS